MLEKKIIEIKPNDNGGSIAQNRFDYQKNYIICKLLEKFQDDDFVLVVEYHDDFIIFDKKTNPSKIDFFQVKTSEKLKWTSKKLSTKKKTEKKSIFGKMYNHINNFDNSVNSANFISNNSFNVLLKKNKETSEVEKFKISELADSSKKHFEESIKNEFGKNNLNEHIDKFNFEKIILDINNYEDLTISKIVRFIESKFQADSRPELIHSFLFNIIKQKSNIEGEILTFSDLITKKGITKSNIEEIFKTLELDKQENERIKSIRNIVMSEGFDYKLKYTFDDNIKKIKNEYLNKSNKTFFLKVKQINSIINTVNKELSLINIIENIFNVFNNTPKKYEELNTDIYIKTLIIYEYFKTLN